MKRTYWLTILIVIVLALTAALPVYGQDGGKPKASSEFGGPNSSPSFAVTGALLYEQTGTSSGGTASQIFPDFSNSALESADEFIIPASDYKWNITGVVAYGLFGATGGPIDSMTTNIYKSSGGMPGALVCTDNQATADGLATGDMISYDLSSPCKLKSGTYWISVLAVMSFSTNGQWYWNRIPQVGAEAHFQDTDGLVGPPQTWTPFSVESGGAWDPGLAFEIYGAKIAKPAAEEEDAADEEAAEPVPGPDMVEIPTQAVVGTVLADTPVYFAPQAGAATTLIIPADKTMWVYGMDASGMYYKVMLSGKYFWMPASSMGPNYDEVWNGTPLPTAVVE